MTINEDIREINERNDLSIKEKLERLDQLKRRYALAIEHEKESLKSDYEYCRECGEYYLKKSWDDLATDETRMVCSNPLTGGYLDDYEYEAVKYKVWYRICPRGHRIEKDSIKIW